ncbi:hypothetical protein K2173_004785 [Erythroxylum novogranatense]|uniref:RNase H type-1 domain-containing protein n=1 Tax=Erythroxylum novogranatense TaxID=1862640 RepID=A0AAV8SJR0_9ROSI|nr:hypothetical protein K2173_004785 [Erythroxylum novogranatense]
MSPKLKNFMWRALRDILPTCCKLLQRHLNICVDCVHCGVAEDVDHALVFCPEARSVWARWGGGSIVREGVGFNRWFTEVCEKESTVLVIQWCSLASKLWQARNDRIWEAKRYSSFTLYRMALGYINDWQQANMSSSVPSRSGEGRGAVEGLNDEAQLDWLCFVDGATFMERCLYGYGVICQDGEGNFVRAVSGHFVGRCSADVVEVVALREALTWVLPLCHGRGIFYSDAQHIISAMNSFHDNWTEFGRVILECKQLLHVIPHIKVCWVRRQANVKAHTLARVSHLYASRCSWDSPLTL